MSGKPIPIPERSRIRVVNHKNKAVSGIPDPSRKKMATPSANHMQNAETDPTHKIGANPTPRSNGFHLRQSEPAGLSSSAGGSHQNGSCRRSVDSTPHASRDVMFNGGGEGFLKNKTPCRARHEAPAEPPVYPIRATANGMTTAAGHA
jgi:hypothetical protein